MIMCPQQVVFALAMLPMLVLCLALALWQLHRERRIALTAHDAAGSGIAQHDESRIPREHRGGSLCLTRSRIQRGQIPCRGIPDTGTQPQYRVV
jgi:hypothetical protein